MKLTLMVEGSASVIAAILATLPDGASVATPAPAATAPVPPMPSGDDGGDEAGDTPAVAGQADVNGVLHDTRIHSDKPTLTGKQEWRKRRGVSDELVAQVEAEQRAARGSQPMPAIPAAPAPLPTMTPPPPMPIPAPEPVAAAPVPPMPIPAPEPVAAAPVAAPQAQPTPAVEADAPAPMDFSTFMTQFAGRMALNDPATGGKLITPEYIAGLMQQMSQAFGVTLNVITDIIAANDPRMVPYIIQLLQRDGKWT